MPRKPKQPLESATFRAHLEQALDHYADARWLGEHSPLAAPYVLGGALIGEPDADTSVGRGRALQKKLLAAAASLNDAEKRLLQLTYFRPKALRTQAGIATELAISPATYYRQRADAITRLEAAFARLMPSPARAAPPALPMHLIGREPIVQACARGLRNGQTLSLTGPGGLGKTTLGAALVEQRGRGAGEQGSATTPLHLRTFPPSPTFWFTFRPGLNDHLHSLVFALAHFLHQHGQSGLWLQLAANKGRADDALALALATEGLAKLEPAPLLAFDETDLLLPNDFEREEHARIRSFLEALVQSPRGPSSPRFPAMFIGQQLVIETDLHFILEGFTPAEMAQALREAGIQLSRDEAARLREFTHGSPLLVRLFIALHHSGEPIGESLRALGAAPSVGLLLQRIQRRLGLNEKRALMALSVFRTAAPADAFGALGDALERLTARGLVIGDGAGGAELQPALRAAVAQQLSAETRADAHRFAAEALAARGQYAEAAYHFVEAGDPALAIRTWAAHSQHEIARGDAAAALDTFKRISRDALDDEDRRALVLLRSELRERTGESEAALEDLDAIDWRADDPATPRARLLEGLFAATLGQREAALDRYRAGLRTASQQLEWQQAQLHTRLGNLMLRDRDFDAAWRESVLIQFEAEHLQGDIESERGQYAPAQARYEAALRHAEAANDVNAQGRAHMSLATLAARHEDSDVAAQHYAQAEQRFEAEGNRVRAMQCRANLAATRVQLQDYAAAVEPARQAYGFFERAARPYWAALCASNLAEAQLHLGQLDEAEHFAQVALRAEEEDIRPYALTTLGLVALQKRKTQDAKHLLQEAITMAEQIEDQWAVAAAKRALAEVMFARGEADAGRKALDEALAIYADLGLSREVERTRRVLEFLQR
jgi:hypothetical protein